MYGKMTNVYVLSLIKFSEFLIPYTKKQNKKYIIYNNLQRNN